MNEVPATERWDRYGDRTRARRAAARRLHPDRGGDPAAFVEALAAIDEAFPDPARTDTRYPDHNAVIVVHLHRRHAGVRRWARRAIRIGVRVLPGIPRYSQV
jgi:hypothetical protein